MPFFYLVYLDSWDLKKEANFWIGTIFLLFSMLAQNSYKKICSISKILRMSKLSKIFNLFSRSKIYQKKIECWMWMFLFKKYCKEKSSIKENWNYRFIFTYFDPPWFSDFRWLNLYYNSFKEIFFLVCSFKMWSFKNLWTGNFWWHMVQL